MVVPGTPYHVTHRENRRGRVFADGTDRDAYLTPLERCSHVCGLGIWAWCLIYDRTHLPVRPASPESQPATLGNSNHGMSGHPWANRTCSTPPDRAPARAAARYVVFIPFGEVAK